MTSGQPLAIHPVQPGQVDHPQAEAPLLEEFRSQQGFVEHHGAIGKQHGVPALGQGHAPPEGQPVILGQGNDPGGGADDQAEHAILRRLIHTILNRHPGFRGIGGLQNLKVG